MGVGALAVRFLRVGAIENDHFITVARAHQVIYGDLPVRDIVDPGMPLGYLLSALAAWVAGPTLLTEVVLQATLFAVAATFVYALSRRASGSSLVAVILVVLVIAFAPRLYNSSKVLVHVVAMALAWRWVDRPTNVRLAALAAWTVVAFLFRHDHALYIGVATAVLIVARSRFDPSGSPRSWQRIRSDLAIYTGVVVLLAMPWLLYVHWAQGFFEYFASAVRFSMAEALRTGTRPAVGYLVAAAALAGLAMARRPPSGLTMAHVTFAATLVLLIGIAFVRDRAAARLPDILPALAVLAAWPLGLVRPPPFAARWAMVAVAAAGVAVLVASAGQRVRLTDVPGRFGQVAGRLNRASPEIMPNPALLPLIEFVSRCTAGHERVLVSGFGPEIAVLAKRPFAGGLPVWLPGYYQSDVDILRAQRRVQTEPIAMVILLEGEDSFASSWPALAAYFKSRRFESHAVVTTTSPVTVWVAPAFGSSLPDDCRRAA